jgi:DNA-binding Lrp family transcriptional regulator
MKEYKLDKRDRDILSVLSNNARLSYNQIAKITRISKDRVRARILNMEKEGFIISYYPLINYAKLGLPLFNVYCRLKSIKYISKNKIKSLVDNCNVMAITWLMGKFDLELQVMARNKKEVKNILKKTGFINNIQEYKISRPGKPIIYSTTHMRTKILDEYTNDKLEILDKKDLKLISLLCINAREKIINLADKLNLDESEVRYRIKKLINKDIIWGFHAATNRTFVGLTRYLVLIKVKNSLREEDISSLKNIKSIFYLKRCDGNWNYLLRFQAANDRELINQFHNLKSAFSNNLVDFKIHTILQIVKFNPMPALALK